MSIYTSGSTGQPKGVQFRTELFYGYCLALNTSSSMRMNFPASCFEFL